MSAQSLTAKYRPQRFSDVAGQEAVKRILSKASAEDKVAPAYLFSGTRGVGKTTLARVLAKALNCLTAPTAEPCNECSQCRQITAGVSPDVIEIDAATHGNVEEARRLKEDIGYAPLQSRYKVFIIDEAHMLSKAAFNALLKTLEEPPGRVTFILATTEPHKILPTIISRCQHYVFKRLMQPELEAHLAGLLDREGMGYEHPALSLIARRGAGSVRDSMSLLAQVLAMGGERLTEQDVRDVLGLAGQDVFFSFMRSFQEEDCLGVSGLLRNVLDRGLDIGFFLRELASCWRNMFLLNQAGEKALPTLEMTQEEGGQWLHWARQFDARHIHACWQMTLEGQRRVMTSLEPALALELLLLNLAYIPKLLSLEAMSAGAGQIQARSGPSGAPRPASAPQYGQLQRPAPHQAPPQAGYQPQGGAPYGGPPPAPPGQPYGAPQGAGQYGAPAGGSQGGYAPPGGGNYGAPGATPQGGYAPPGGQESRGPAGTPGGVRQGGYQQQGGAPYGKPPQAPLGQPYGGPRPASTGDQPPGAPVPPQGGSPSARSGQGRPAAYGREPAPGPGNTEPEPGPEYAGQPRSPLGPPTWKGFKDYARHEVRKNPLLKVALPQLKGKFDETAEGGVLRIECRNEFQAGQIKDRPDNIAMLSRLAEAYFGRPVTLRFAVDPEVRQFTQQELKAKAEQSALFREARESMGAYIIDVRAKN
ncbi:MAG: DNA polymerase III subunit gamma/tau [Thermodesulfobacteriota bacterium]